MNNVELPVQLNAVSRIGMLAKVVGPEVTRSQLLPFVLQKTALDAPEDKLADEVLFHIAKALGDFVAYLGGTSHVGLLLSPLAEIATTEETLVRDSAVEAIVKICSALPRDGSMSEVALGTLRRLSGTEEQTVWFTAKVSACGVLAGCFPLLNDEGKRAAVEIFERHVADDLPMVRRAAAKALGDLGACDGVDVEMLYNVFRRLAEDQYDNVRLVAVESCAAIVKKVPDSLRTSFAQTLDGVGEDKSWRVRLSLCKVLEAACLSLGPSLTRDFLVRLFVALLGDHEAEVRGEACKAIEVVCRVAGAEVFTSTVVPVIEQLALDAEHDMELKVRTPLVKAVTRLPHLLGQEAAAQSILPILKACIMGDANGGGANGAAIGLGSSDLQLMILHELTVLGAVCEVDEVSYPWVKDRGTEDERDALTGVIVNNLGDEFLRNLLADANWRVKEAAVLSVPKVVSVMGVDFFSASLEEAFLQLLEDKVAAVRGAAGMCFGPLLEQLGNDFMLAKVIPRVAQQVEAESYSYRISAVEALANLCTPQSSPALIDAVSRLVKQAATDRVANVKLASITAYRALAKVAPTDLVRSQVSPQLTELLQDDDDDVKHNANKLLMSIDE